VKRCVNVDDDLFQKSTPETIQALLEGIKRGDIWLSKIRYDRDGLRIYGNVCLEVYLRSRGTCLLSHVNLGQCTIETIPGAFRKGMQELLDLHPQTGVGETGEYLLPEWDKQVGLGVLGFANFLAHNAVTYKEFADAWERFVEFRTIDSKADKIVAAIRIGLYNAESLARECGMHRAFCIAPTASCSYESVDIHGYTCTPEIAPPIGRSVDRDSGTFGVKHYEYPPDVEIASEVGWRDYKRATDAWVEMFQETGLFHGYSFNSWSDIVTYDETFLASWLASPQTSLYYSLQVTPDTQSKDKALAALEEDYHELFKFDEIDTTSTECTDTFCPACAE